MAYSFNGTTKIISLIDITILDVRDLYSRWKDWSVAAGSGFLQAMSVVGGDAVDVAQGIYVTSYFFLENGWKIRPQEDDHKLIVNNGVLVDGAGGDPFVPTLGTFNVLVQYSQPVKSETVNISGGGGSTPAEIWAYSSRELTVSGETSIAEAVRIELATELAQIMKTMTVAKFLGLKDS